MPSDKQHALNIPSQYISSKLTRRTLLTWLASTPLVVVFTPLVVTKFAAPLAAQRGAEYVVKIQNCQGTDVEVRDRGNDRVAFHNTDAKDYRVFWRARSPFVRKGDPPEHFRLAAADKKTVTVHPTADGNVGGRPTVYVYRLQTRDASGGWQDCPGEVAAEMGLDPMAAGGGKIIVD